MSFKTDTDNTQPTARDSGKTAEGKTYTREQMEQAMGFAFIIGSSGKYSEINAEGECKKYIDTNFK